MEVGQSLAGIIIIQLIDWCSFNKDLTLFRSACMRNRWNTSVNTLSFRGGFTISKNSISKERFSARQ